MVFAGGRFGKKILARHTDLHDAGSYPNTDLTRTTRARRSTNKRKSRRKERINMLPTQDLENEKRRADKHWD
jgi:CRISPR/Cas system Type II protein with McrA/HNH and RuvC-like nuclease domain